MYYVYLLRSKTHSDQTYVGSTADLRKRVAGRNEETSAKHNALEGQLQAVAFAVAGV